MVYGDGTVTDVACKGLNGMRMGDRTLTVRRATEVMYSSDIQMLDASLPVMLVSQSCSHSEHRQKSTLLSQTCTIM